MEKETISPYASYFEMSEEIYLILGTIKDLLTYGFGFIVIILVFVLDEVLNLNILREYFGYLGIIAGIFAIIVLYATIPIYKDISKWEKNYINSKFFMYLSWFPLEEGYEYPKDELLFLILRTFSRYYDIWDDYGDQALHKLTNVTIEGKTKEHQFDVFIAELRRDDDDEETKKMMDKLKNKGYTIAKIFDKMEHINSSDLDEFRNDIIDATTNRGIKRVFSDELSPFRIIVVSKSSYADDAIEYVKEQKNWIKGVSFDLIEQKDDVSNIVWIS